MPGSPTTPGWPSARVGALGHIAFHYTDSVGTRYHFSIAAQWLACAFPCRRFADILADACARLGADVGRYSFIAVDLHHLLLAGLPAHPCEKKIAASHWAIYCRCTGTAALQRLRMSYPKRNRVTGFPRRVSPIAPRSRKGPLTEPIADAQPRSQEGVLMPQCRLWTFQYYWLCDSMTVGRRLLRMRQGPVFSRTSQHKTR